MGLGDLGTPCRRRLACGLWDDTRESCSTNEAAPLKLIGATSSRLRRPSCNSENRDLRVDYESTVWNVQGQLANSDIGSLNVRYRSTSTTSGPTASGPKSATSPSRAHVRVGRKADRGIVTAVGPRQVEHERQERRLLRVKGTLPSETKRIDDSRKCRRGMPSVGVVQVIARKRLAPVFQNPDQVTPADLIHHLVLGHIRQTKST